MPVEKPAIDWSNLTDAYGPAVDVPKWLEKVLTAKGRALGEALGELYSRVLHQGTIYSASPIVCAAIVEALENPAAPVAARREALLELLAGFAQAARLAIADGKAIPGRSGGDPVDGEAIRDILTRSKRVFVARLADEEPRVRALAAELLTAFPGLDRADIDAVESLYAREPEHEVRRGILEGLARTGTSREFVASSLLTESNPYNQFLLHRAKILESPAAAEPASIQGMVAGFAANNTPYFVHGEAEFFGTLALLGQDPERHALLEALEMANEPAALRCVAERLLRLVFHDQRTGWGQVSHGILNADGSPPKRRSLVGLAIRSIGLLIVMKLCPPLFRWRVTRQASRAEEPQGIQKVDYWGLKGHCPEMPQTLSAVQIQTLQALAAKSQLWSFRTNLWQLFGLPDRPELLREFAASRSPKD